jgi:uncharacterized Zn-binding protein involved in type VI secretion
MADDYGVARVDRDKAGSPIIEGAHTVFTENFKTSTQNVSVTAGPKNVGDVILSSETQVYAENQKVAVVGSTTARGYAVGDASPVVLAGLNGAAVKAFVENDDINDGTPNGAERSKEHLYSMYTTEIISTPNGDLAVFRPLNPIQPNRRIFTPPAGAIQPPAVQENRQSVIAPDEPSERVLVIMFRGKDPTVTSAGVDYTADLINKLPGYKALAYNAGETTDAHAQIRSTDKVILYGFSLGGESVKNFATLYPRQKIELAIILDTYPGPINWLSNIKNLAKNVARGINWYNPNWDYLKDKLKNVESTDTVTHIKDPSTPSTATHIAFPRKHADEVLTQVKTIKPTTSPRKQDKVVEGDAFGTPEPSKQGAITSAFPGIIRNEYSLNTKISKTFTLGDMLQSFKGVPVTYKASLAARNGFTAGEVVNNLSLYAQNILEPLYAKYPGMFITSCLRETVHDKYDSLIISQHNVGQACDIQFNDTNNASGSVILERVNWMKTNLPFDQLLLETTSKNKTFWIHMSFVGANVSRSVGGNEIKGNRSYADKAKFGTLMDHQWAGYSKFIDPRPK